MASADLTSVAADANYEIDISNIREINVTALKCISFLTDLSISAPDFGIDHLDKKDMPLIKHPDSFCTTTWQIAPECFSAFKKAHGNMECIMWTMERFSIHVADCMEYMKSKSKDEDVENLLRPLLEGITKAAEEGAHLIQEVCDTFDLLGKLLSQVIEACKASKNREKEILTDRITNRKKKMEETVKSKVEAKEREEKQFQRETEQAERNLSEKIKYLDDIRKSKLHVWLPLLGIHSECVGYARQMLEEAETRLKETKEEAEKSEKRSNEEIQKWKDKQVELNKTLDQTEKHPINEDDIRVLALLRDKCLGMNRYFNQIRNYATDVTLPMLTDFSAKVENVGSNILPIEELEKSLRLTWESCAKMQHLAKVYVQCKKFLREDELPVDIKELFQATEGDTVNGGKI